MIWEFAQYHATAFGNYVIAEDKIVDVAYMAKNQRWIGFGVINRRYYYIRIYHYPHE